MTTTPHTNDSLANGALGLLIVVSSIFAILWITIPFFRGDDINWWGAFIPLAITLFLSLVAFWLRYVIRGAVNEAFAVSLTLQAAKELQRQNNERFN